jgi:hypothetical protein
MTDGRGRTAGEAGCGRESASSAGWSLVLLGELVLAVGLVVFIRQQGRAFAPGTPGDSVIEPGQPAVPARLGALAAPVGTWCRAVWLRAVALHARSRRTVRAA